jgi:hypothetical protein
MEASLGSGFDPKTDSNFSNASSYFPSLHFFFQNSKEISKLKQSSNHIHIALSGVEEGMISVH